MQISIETNAPVKSSAEIIVEAPVVAVWRVLTEIDKWPDWQESVTSALLKGPLVPGTRFDWKSGGLKFISHIHTCEPHMEFGWTGKTFGARAIHNWTFTEQGNQTRVAVEESLNGIFPRLFRKGFQKTLETGMSKSLEELRRAVENIVAQ